MKDFCNLLEFLINEYFYYSKRVKNLLSEESLDPEEITFLKDSSAKLYEVISCLRMLDIYESMLGLKWGKYQVVLASTMENYEGEFDNFIILNKDGTYRVLERVYGYEKLEYETTNYQNLRDLIQDCFGVY